MNLEKTEDNWDKFFISMAYLVGLKSKDPSSKIGSVIVSSDNKVISIGYNGLPRHIEDKPERYERPLKYSLTIHSEENSILNCSNTSELKGSRIYVPLMPCLERCIPRIIQAGIKEVIVDKLMIDRERQYQTDGNRKQWADDWELSLQLLKEADIKIKEYSGDILINDHIFLSGEKYDLVQC